MKIFRKKELIAATLVVLIGCAGYLNWSYQDTVKVTDNDSYVETGKKLGEAQYVSREIKTEDAVPSAAPSPNSDNTQNNEDTADTAEQANSDGADNKADAQKAEETVKTEVKEDTDGTYFEKAKYDRENSRSKSMEILNQTASNESFDAETRKKAGDKLIAAAQNIEKEQELESIAQSKGYSEVCAYVNGEKVNITVRKADFSKDDVMKLTEIAQDCLGVGAGNIKIIEVK